MAPKTPERERRKRDKVINDAATIAQQQIDLVDLTTDGSERETFVSARGQLHVHPSQAAGGFLSMAIVRIPKGTAVLTLSTANDTELYAALEHLLWGECYDQAGDVDTEEFIRIPMDVGAKRKMRPGDKIAFLYKGTVDGGWNIAGHLASFSLE